MALKPAICTQCGAPIEVDDSHEAGICPNCGTAYITEKVVNRYITNHETVHNVENHIVKNIYGQEKDEAEDFIQRGLTQLKLQDWEKAEEAFKKAADIAPERAECWFYLLAADTCNWTNTASLDWEKNKYLKKFFLLASVECKERFEKEYGLPLSLSEESFRKDIYVWEAKNAMKHFGEYALIPSEKLKKAFRAASSNLRDELAEEFVGYYKKIIDLFKKQQSDGNFYHGRTNSAASLYETAKEYLTAKVQSELLEAGKYVFNPLDERGCWKIYNTGILPCDENGALRTDDPEIKSVGFRGSGPLYLKKLIVSPNVDTVINYGSKEVKIDVLEFEEGCGFSPCFTCFHLAQKAIIMPDSWKNETHTAYSFTYNSALVLYMKNGYSGKIVEQTRFKNPLNSVVTVTKTQLGTLSETTRTYPTETEGDKGSPKVVCREAFEKNIIDVFGREYLTKTTEKKVGGCYIATCVYGSYDCPEVWTLRRFRDDTLAKSAFGRWFIRCYYAVSPKLVRAFGNNSVFRRFWKRALDKKVARLQAKGVKNTPYSDR